MLRRVCFAISVYYKGMIPGCVIQTVTHQYLNDAKFTANGLIDTDIDDTILKIRRVGMRAVESFLYVYRLRARPVPRL